MDVFAKKNGIPTLRPVWLALEITRLREAKVDTKKFEKRAQHCMGLGRRGPPLVPSRPYSHVKVVGAEGSAARPAASLRW